MVAAWIPSLSYRGVSFKDETGNRHDANEMSNVDISNLVISANPLNKGMAVRYNGSNEQVGIPVDGGAGITMNVTVGTVCAWVRTDAPGASFRFFFGRTQNWNLGFLDNDFGHYSWGGEGWQSSGFDGNDGLWHLYAMTFSSGIASASALYVDGEFAATASTTFTVSTNKPYLGSRSTQYCACDISDAWLWNRKLSKHELADIYRDSASMFRVARPFAGFVPAAAAGLGIPLAMYHYRHHGA